MQILADRKFVSKDLLWLAAGDNETRHGPMTRSHEDNLRIPYEFKGHLSPHLA